MDNIQQEPRQKFIKRRSPIVFFIFAVIPSVIFELLYIYFGLYELLFAIPFSIFISLHYTGYWGIKVRLKHGIPVIIILWILFTAIAVPVSYVNTTTITEPTTSHGSVMVGISPYTGYSSTHDIYANFTGLATNVTFHPSLAIYSAPDFQNQSYVSFQNTTASHSYLNLSHSFTNLPAGTYYVVATLNYSKGNITTGFIRGPINQGEFSYTLFMLYNYIPLFGLIAILYIAGLFIARSLSNSASRRHLYSR